MGHTLPQAPDGFPLNPTHFLERRLTYFWRDRSEEMREKDIWLEITLTGHSSVYRIRILYLFLRGKKHAQKIKMDGMISVMYWRVIKRQAGMVECQMWNVTSVFAKLGCVWAAEGGWGSSTLTLEASVQQFQNKLSWFTEIEVLIQQNLSTISCRWGSWF